MSNALDSCLDSKPGASLLAELAGTNDERAAKVVELAAALRRHRVYRSLDSPDRLRLFMSWHIWCCWDFMCLAKSIQQRLGCYEMRWLPPADYEAVRLISAILAEEEADLAPDESRKSHFELYHDACREARVSTVAIDSFLTDVRAGRDLFDALEVSGADAPVIDFVRTTIRLAQRPVHESVAAFCIAREEIVPRMFRTLVADLASNGVAMKEFGRLRWYLERHISLDESSHAPIGMALFHRVVGPERRRKEEALDAALLALMARQRLLDAFAERLATSDTETRCAVVTA